MKIKSKSNILLSIIFIGIILLLSISNLNGLKDILMNELSKQSLSDFKEVGSQIEEDYRASFVGKVFFSNVYGGVQLVLNKDMIGNFEYIKDEQGFLHMLNDSKDASKFNQDIVKLNQILCSQDIPLVYVQIPSREIDNFTELSEDIVNTSKETINSILNNLDDNNIDYLDISMSLKNNEYPKEQLYFKTDIHMKTEAELWVLEKIIAHLESKYDMEFMNKNQVLNFENYEIINKKMLGNLGRSAGKYYAGLDDFRLYYPKFSTNFELDNYSSGVVKYGDFTNTIMNGLDSNDYMTYWVTDFLQWPSPYYNIKNNNLNHNNVLVIMDSLGLRTTSYLSLLCNNVTVLDPRYFNGVNYIDEALLNQKYDVVIVLQSIYLTDSRLFPEK